MSTAFVFVPSMGHTLRQHPEHAGRLQAVWRVFEGAGILDQLHHIVPRLATIEEVRRVHTPAHIELIRWAARQGGGFIDSDTYVTAASFDAALLAAGSVMAVVDAMAGGLARNGLAVVRPPGHHASADRAEGFCLFNNAALAARHAQAAHGWQRVLIVDFDVHHGNGTQAIFYEDDSVMFVSLHQYSAYFYPGTGSLVEIGLHSGHGYTLNVPFPPGVGDVAYETVFRQVIWPRVEQHRPDFIVVSAGFDAHWRDPLAHAQLTLAGYNRLVQTMLEWADSLCQGRILFVSEGGYDLEVLSYGLLNVAHALLEHDDLHDPVGTTDDELADISLLLRNLKSTHLL